MNGTPHEAIHELVNREAKGWDIQDVESLLNLCHPDMVWTWPPTGYDHNPETWELEFGRFDCERWRANWQELFDTHQLVHNNRKTKQIKVSGQQDGGLPVVDIDK